MTMSDDDQIYADYYYLVDGSTVLSGITGRVRDLKARLGANKVETIDMVSCGLRPKVR